MKHVLVIDYGVGNLKSICRAIDINGARVNISSESSLDKEFTHIVLPGVGTAKYAMNYLRLNKIEPTLRKYLSNGTPILGICLGMQLFSTISFEDGITECLDLIPGKVIKLDASTTLIKKRPRIGWYTNQYLENGNELFTGIEPDVRFYFSHNFHFKPNSNDSVISQTDGNICSAVFSQNIYGVQFHPEKSGIAGLKVINNFLQKTNYTL
jgi:glutamine amidotransferase